MCFFLVKREKTSNLMNRKCEKEMSSTNNQWAWKKILSPKWERQLWMTPWFQPSENLSREYSHTTPDFYSTETEMINSYCLKSCTCGSLLHSNKKLIQIFARFSFTEQAKDMTRAKHTAWCRLLILLRGKCSSKY